MAIRLIRCAALGAVALLLLTACATGDASDRAGAPRPAHETSHRGAITAVHTVRPYNADGALRVGVQRTGRGSCWTASIAASSALTFRCMSGNTILDPCFAASRSATRVACLADPWSRAVVLRLRHKLPAAGGRARVWALKLADGTRCTAATGTVAYVDGRNLADNCTRGLAAEIVDPHARSMVALVGRPGGHSLHRVAVRGVWRA